MDSHLSQNNQVLLQEIQGMMSQSQQEILAQ